MTNEEAQKIKVGEIIICISCKRSYPSRDCIVGEEYEVLGYDQKNDNDCYLNLKEVSTGITNQYRPEDFKIKEAVKPIKVKTFKMDKNENLVYKNFMAEVHMDIEPETYAALKYAVNEDRPMLFSGETGCGKTSLIQNYAKFCGKEAVRINLNGQTSVDEILGRYLLKGGETVWQDGILIDAMKKGKWIIFDEINAALPEILMSLHSLLDHDKKVTLVEKDNEEVRPAEDFRFFATMNPDDRYAGTKTLNLAFKSRFPIVAIMNYSPNEKEILIDRTKIDEETAVRLVNIAYEMRSMYKAETCNYPCSTRDILYAAELAQSLDFPTAVKMAIINKADEGEREALAKTISLLVAEEITVDGNDKFKSVKEIIDQFKELKKNNNELKKGTADAVAKAKEAEKKLNDQVAELDKAKKDAAIANAKFEKIDKTFRANVTKLVMDKVKEKKSKS